MLIRRSGALRTLCRVTHRPCRPGVSRQPSGSRRNRGQRHSRNLVQEHEPEPQPEPKPESEEEPKPEAGQWYHVSDTLVREVTLDKVLEAQAHMLFYA